MGYMRCSPHPPTPSFHPPFPLQRGMFYDRAGQRQEIGGQLQRYLLGLQLVGPESVSGFSQESSFSQKVTCAYTAPSTPGICAFRRERE